MQRGLIIGCCLLALTAGVVQTAAAQTDTGSDTDARTLFDQGRVAYEEGRFDDAARAFRRAYVLSPRFALLYNIGQAELRAGRDQLAIEAFEGYLRQAPADDPRRSEVEERARMLHSMGIRAGATETAPLAEPPPDANVVEPVASDPTVSSSTDAATQPVTEDETSTDILPWVLVGGGAVAVVGGVVLMAVGAAKAGNVTGASDGERWSDLEGDASSANTFFGLGLGLSVLGLASAGVGLVLAFGDTSQESPPSPTAQLRIGAGSLMLEGKF